MAVPLIAGNPSYGIPRPCLSVHELKHMIISAGCGRYHLSVRGGDIQIVILFEVFDDEAKDQQALINLRTLSICYLHHARSDP